MNQTQLTVVVAIVERGDQFLIIRRVDEVPLWHHKWELPGGKIEPGETPFDAISREVREETGLVISDFELLGLHTHHWYLPEQTQQTFLIVYRATTDSDAITLQPEENDDFRWVTIDQFMKLENHLEANRDMITSLYQPRILRSL